MLRKIEADPEGITARSRADGCHREAGQKSLFTNRLHGRRRANPPDFLAMNQPAGKRGNQVSNWPESRPPISDCFKAGMETRPPS